MIIRESMQSTQNATIALWFKYIELFTIINKTYEPNHEASIMLPSAVHQGQTTYT